ncbi:hypothetical protein CAEBREN_09341 [Caenorhabditis brenneri]|uniref:Uncharacterized protein n=1 Tax=Caenorhabditis brenneri TaxID=135651 RepID=G0NDZ5_CAEBE|nr:hypothetical protein CAEBREN_09341 [Caenorhabditis brenneri]
MQRGNHYYEAQSQHYYNAYMNAYLYAALPGAGAQQPAMNQAYVKQLCHNEVKAIRSKNFIWLPALACTRNPESQKDVGGCLRKEDKII